VSLGWEAGIGEDVEVESEDGNIRESMPRSLLDWKGEDTGDEQVMALVGLEDIDNPPPLPKGLDKVGKPNLMAAC
jgi:hypothetical protein